MVPRRFQMTERSQLIPLSGPSGSTYRFETVLPMLWVRDLLTLDPEQPEDWKKFQNFLRSEIQRLCPLRSVPAFQLSRRERSEMAANSQALLSMQAFGKFRGHRLKVVVVLDLPEE